MGRGAYILAPLGPDLTDSESAFFRDADPWGFILFARNVAEPGQLLRLTAALRAAVGWEAPVLVDQEGGRVQRMRAPHWREWLPPLDQTERLGGGQAAVRAMFLRGALIGTELSAVGIDVDCAPVLDIAREETHPFLRNRCYGSDAESVTALGRAMAEGLTAAGVRPVVKHAPGHGRAAVDSHLGLPRIDAPLGELEAGDFRPFAALADLPMAMTAHLLIPALDPERSVTFSETAIRYMREKLGMRGLLMSDDISMEALQGSVGARAARSLAAGCDLVLHCNGNLAEMQDVAGAAGLMSEAVEGRAAAALSTGTAPGGIDIEAAQAEFDALLGRAVNA